MRCDEVDIEIPEEYDHTKLEHCLPHDNKEDVKWSLSRALPPEIVEPPEPEDALLQRGLRMGAAGQSRRALSDLTAMLCEYTPI